MTAAIATRVATVRKWLFEGEAVPVFSFEDINASEQK